VLLKTGTQHLLSARQDYAIGAVVHHRDGLPVPLLRTHVQRFLGLPELGERVPEPARAEVRGVTERIGEAAIHRGVAFVRELERVVVEGDAADIVEGEPLEHVLEVKGGAGRRGAAQQREEATVQLGVHAARHEGAERARVELVAGDLPLRAPGLSVGVEDTPAEEVVQQRRDPGPLAVAFEAGALCAGSAPRSPGFAVITARTPPGRRSSNVHVVWRSRNSVIQSSTRCRLAKNCGRCRISGYGSSPGAYVGPACRRCLDLKSTNPWSIDAKSCSSFTITHDSLLQSLRLVLHTCNQSIESNSILIFSTILVT